MIDFRQSRINDPSWWRRWRILTEELARRSDFIVYDARYRFYLALLGNTRLTESSFDKTQESTIELYHDMTGKLRPWEGGYVKKKQVEIQQARQEYKEAFGFDPADPEFLAWEAKQIAAMRAESEQVTETAEQQVFRRMQERKTQQGR